MYTFGCKFEQKPDMRLRRSYAKGIPASSPKCQAHRVLSAWSSKAYKEVSEPLRCNAEPANTTKTSFFAFQMRKPDWSATRRASQASIEAEKVIRRILYAAVDPDLRDEDESAPTLKVIQQAVQLIRGAEKILDNMPSGQVSTFYGEINITWRDGDRIVRLACFPERPGVIQSGSLSLPLGSYRTEENPTPELLATRINSLGH